MQVFTFRPADQDVKTISDATKKKNSVGAKRASLLNNSQFQKLTYITYSLL